MSPLIFRAIEFAACAHRGHYRKGTHIPYIVHPLAVARLLLEQGCPETLAAAAVLHDTVEDTPATLEQIRAEFGDEVARLVAAASEPDKSDTWENRKRHTLECLETASQEVLLLTCADKLDNLRSLQGDLDRLGEEVWARFNRPRDRQEWYHCALRSVFERRLTEGPGLVLVEEFGRLVENVFGTDSQGEANRHD